MNLWRELGVNSWPTFAVVSPNGKLIAQLAGEGHRKVLNISQSILFIFCYRYLVIFSLIPHTY